MWVGVLTCAKYFATYPFEHYLGFIYFGPPMAATIFGGVVLFHSLSSSNGARILAGLALAAAVSWIILPFVCVALLLH